MPDGEKFYKDKWSRSGEDRCDNGLEFQVVSSGESSVLGEGFARDLSLLHVSGTCQAAQIEVRDEEENPLRPPYHHFICWDIFLELLGSLETKIMASGPITSWEIDGETVETVSDFLFWGAPKSLQMVTAAMKLKDAYSLEGKLWPS